MDNERNNLPSASGMERLALCPGSFALEQGCPPEPESGDASSGTRIHAALAEFPRTALEGLSAADVETYDMCVRVADATVAAWCSDGPTWTAKTEQREWLFDGLDAVASGQYDLLLLHGNRALLIDYKTGHGDQPESASNLQLRTLAVLVAEAEPHVEEVTVAIVQPWATMKPQTCVYDADDLGRARREILAILAAARRPDAPLNPGEKQCRYCRAKPVCPALKNQLQIVGNLALSTVTDEDLPRLLELCGAVEGMVASIRARAKALLKTQPDALPGWTLERSQGNREFTEAQEVFAAVADVATVGEFTGRCCKISVVAVEKLLKEKTGLKGKAADAEFQRRLGSYVHREPAESREPKLTRAKIALPAA